MPRAVKGRKKAPGVGAGEAANLLNAIHQHGLDEQDILRILQVDQAPCDHLRSPCRANRKDNVACFCQLVPAETSFRKKGLWQKEQAHLATLGHDPAESKREGDAKPSGLRNLGNTCYANAALQCLFSIPSLRNGIFNAEPRVAAHDIFRQLQALFLQMQFGPRSSVDTEVLAKTLGLDHAVQQDGQEFLKLLLTRVEQMLSKSSDSAARGMVQRLFRGGLSYVTTCQRCGRDSASSREVQDFYDLMPQVRGFTSLTESLAAILHADCLTGDNRYRCEFCSDKVDALRHVRLRSLPPYLCLALQRFYFDPRTADKAKALDKFSFPLQLNFSQVLEAAAKGNAMPPPAWGGGAGGATCAGSTAAAAAAAAAALEVPKYAAGSPVYELVAILIHKGSQASSGHYVAHIKDQTSGLWWRFDDERADCIGASPTAAFHADHGSAAGGAAGAAAAADGASKGSGASRKRAAIGDPAGDPDYEDEQEARDQPANDDDDEPQSPPPGKPAKGGGRGKKGAAAAQGRQRGRPPKRTRGGGAAAGNGRSTRGRPRAAATANDNDDDNNVGEDDMARAMAASLAMQKGTAQDDEDLRRALAASLVTQQGSLGGGGGEEAEMAAVLAESACLHAAAPLGDGVCEPGRADVGEPREAQVEAAAANGPQGAAREEASPSGRAGAPDDAALEGKSFGPTVHFGGPGLWAGADGADKGADPSGQGGSGQMVVSANAYMLVYRALGFDEPPAVADAAALPDELQAAAAVATAGFAEECDVYQRQLQALKDQLASRQRAVREVMASITPCLHSAKQQQQSAQEQAQEIDLTGGPDKANGHDAKHLDADADADAEGGAAGGTGSGPAPSQGAELSEGAGTVGYWVSTAWLERWANDEGAPPPLDNSAIVCTSHGAAAAGAGAEGEGGGGVEARCARLDPKKVAAAKLVSPEAWKRLLAAHGGGPTLTAGDVCLECLANNFNAALLGSQADLVRARVAALLGESAAAGQAEDEEAGGGGGSEAECMDEDEAGLASSSSPSSRRFWVSRMWLQGWSKRQGASVKAEKSPTADVVCPHGQLLPPAAAKTARRVAVPADVWYFLRDLWRQQRVREAQEALEARSAAAAAAATKAAGRGSGRAATRSGSAPAPAAQEAVDCLDLTGDDAGPVPAAIRARAAADCKRPGGDGGWDEGDDDDDGVVEVLERSATEARAASAAPSSCEATADMDEEPPASNSGGGPAAAAATATPPAAVPTPQQLDGLCPELQVGRVHECRECCAAAGQAAEAQAGTRRQVDAERTALGGLAAEVVPTLEQGGGYYLIPSAWVREWQQFVRPVPRRGASGAVAGAPAGVAAAGGPGGTAAGGAAAAAASAPAARPGPVLDAMLRVLCPCHPTEARLGVPAPRLTLKRNKLCQQDPDQDALRVVMPDDWRQLCRLYGGSASACSTKRPAAAAATASVATDSSRRPQRRAAAARGAAAAAAATAGNVIGGRGGSGSARINLADANDSEEDLVLELEAPPGRARASSQAPAVGGNGVEGSGGSEAEDGASLRLAAVLQGFTAEVAQPQAAPTLAAAADTGVCTDDLSGPGGTVPRDRGGWAAAPVPELRVWPPVCLEALAAHNRAMKEAMLSYHEAEVMVELVPEDELEGAFRTSIQAPERKSKRSRKGRIALTVSNTTTLEQLKLQVYEHLSIHPRNQSMYVRGGDGCPRPLEGDDLSLAQHEVLPGEEIRLVRRSLVGDDEDVSDLLGAEGGGRGKKRQVEEGFKNTALHGDLPVQQQQQQQQRQRAPADAAEELAAAGLSGAPGGAACGSPGHQSEGVLSDG